MERKTKISYSRRPIRVVYIAVFLYFFVCLVTSCDQEDRTTVIYGKVTDQNLKAVDSILVTASGLWDLNIEVVKQAYTDQNGEYELVIDVPKKYTKLNTGIPYLPIENPKFQWNYDIDKVWKNSEQTTNCCTASIGEKTEYNFQLKLQK